MSDTKQTSQQTEVAVIGAGILGLLSALQFAKRGLKVTLIDNLVQQKRSFKVGESLLIFSNPFLRNIGGLDDFCTNSYPKDGVWFVYGMEGKETFAGETEWAFQAKVPKPWMDNLKDQRLPRSMFYDAQIVRPEAEDLLREKARATPNIRFLDSAKVKDFKIAEDETSLHTVNWECGVTKERGTVEARWLYDCSGRTRLLAKALKHACEDREMNDEFQTTAVWAQFDHIEDDMFGGPWNYDFKDGGVSTLRDRCTAHLWGDGYWIWVIRLTGKRISIGVTWDQRKKPPGKTVKEQFWNVINRYPLLTRALKEEHVLEFRQYANVQYMTDTFVSEKRYGMVGDAGSILDAYYSQGVSLSCLTSWHVANIIEDDLRHDKFDREYIRHVNRATRQDWHMMRNMIVEKYTSAIQDPRFFILSHLLDFSVFSNVLMNRWQLVKWLVETEGETSRESPWHKEVREKLKKTLYYSQTYPWSWLPPETVQKLQRRFQRGLGERARWRLEHGVKLGEIKMIARPHGKMPNLFRMATAPKDKVTDLSPVAMDLPKFMLLDGTEKSPTMFRVGGPATLSLFLMMYGYDAAETGVRKALHRLKGKSATKAMKADKGVAESKPIASASKAAPWGEALKKGDLMPDVVVAADDGRERRLSDYWREQPTAFVFIRHFGCPHCRYELTRLRRDRAQIERVNGRIVVVTMGTPAKAAEFKSALKLDFPHLADPDERAYEACGLLVIPPTPLEIVKAISQDVPEFVKANVKGEYGKRVRGGNGFRLGGTFIADKEGRLAYVFRSRSTASTAPFEELLDAFRRIAGLPSHESAAPAVNGEAPVITISKSPVMG